MMNLKEAKKASLALWRAETDYLVAFGWRRVEGRPKAMWEKVIDDEPTRMSQSAAIAT